MVHYYMPHPVIKDPEITTKVLKHALALGRTNALLQHNRTHNSG